MADDSRLMEDMLDFSDDTVDDIFSHLDFHVDYRDEGDRKLYFDYLIKECGGKDQLNGSDDKNKDIYYERDMFIVLKLFKESGDFINAIVKADLDILGYEEFIEDLLLKKVTLMTVLIMKIGIILLMSF